jgi:phosphatidylserine/phosphatidylglycerophosphate/cardiolipin synthase-like enzyme
VDVKMVLDASQAGTDNSVSPKLLQWLGPERVQYNRGRHGGIMHHKFCVIDGNLVMTGSFNWTTAADAKNWENFVTAFDSRLAASFLMEWQLIWDAATGKKARAE